MKTNITLKFDAALLREIRNLADEESISSSAWLVARLEEIIHRRRYDRARARALSRLAQGLDVRWTPPQSRDELRDR